LFMEAVIDSSTGRSLPPGAMIGKRIAPPSLPPVLPTLQ
jgi:hypothetical protein